MPKQMNSEYKLNFPESAQTRFDKLCKNENWSWAGLALALIGRFGVQEVKKFHETLGVALEKLN
jgi:hypothetical protein